MAWIWLLVAGLLEIGWAAGLVASGGLTRFWPSLFTVAAMALSLLFLNKALLVIPMGTGYAIWTAIGTIGTAVLGILLFGEPASMLRLLCLGMIVGGVVGLKMLT
jgi:quaternary ammonium compound-resistance protein SugE